MAALLAAVLCLVSCEKPLPTDNGNNHVNPTATQRMLVLNEGAWGRNDASLTYIDNADGTMQNLWFANTNGRGLGDVAQDIIIYGSRAYVTVTFSNSLEIIDTATGISTRIDLGDRTPRYIAASGGKLFVTCYRPHSVVRIDTATLAVEATCILGSFNPEGIAAVAGRLFVASSYVQTANSSYRRDSLLYVVDPVTMQIDTTLVVGLNPQLVVGIDDNLLAVTYTGDYSDGSDGAAIVDATTLAVHHLDIPLTGICAANGQLYGYHRIGYGAESTATYYRISTSTYAAATIPLTLGNPYGISVDPLNDDIYIFSDGDYTANGDIYCYSSAGALRWQSEAGILPKKAIFFAE